jgi:hypothetical protein
MGILACSHRLLLLQDRWALDNDPLGLFLADRLTPLVHDASGVVVKPAFVKAAWYEAGAKLPPHRDQAMLATRGLGGCRVA